MIIAIYLGWIRHNKCGGVESFTRNLIDGFLSLNDKNTYYLICSSDNYKSFRHYGEDDRVKLVDAGFDTSDLRKSIFFENFRLDKMVSNIKAEICFVPTYRVPLYHKKNKFVGVIHDLQVCHYPENFTWFRRNWIEFGSKRCAQSSYKIVAISDFVRNDVISKFKCNSENIVTIHNPILPKQGVEKFSIASSEYGIEKDGYFYTVSSLAKHKNVITLLRLMKLIRDKADFSIPQKLIVSGIGVGKKDADNIDSNSILSYVKENNLEKNVIFTGFVSDERRNSLIKNSSFFLFPSMFEGFGMPPLEAMRLGAKVITTNRTSLPEVTHNEAIYVENPLDEEEWYCRIVNNIKKSSRVIQFEENNTQYVAKKYLNLLYTAE